MAEKTLVCLSCKLPDDVWSFQTEIMPRKIYLCWDHLQKFEALAAQRGAVNIFNTDKK